MNYFVSDIFFDDACMEPYGCVTFKFGIDFLNTVISIMEAEFKNAYQSLNNIKT
jgi:hypothetical protein